MKKIHVMHVVPAMSAGLATMLSSAGWAVTLHGEQPEALLGADIVVADYDGGLALARSASAGAGRAVLVVTHRDCEADLRSAVSARVAGYLRDDAGAAQLQLAVRHILAGSVYVCPGLLRRIDENTPHERLTKREREVLRLLAKGYCNKLIARDLGIGVGTVKGHVRGVMGKLGATARTHAVVVAAQRGLVGIDRGAIG
jgi:DNA-binding NarL/FixJ family response regulator